MVHLRFEGRSYDIPDNQLPVHQAMTDQQLFASLARHLDVSTKSFQNYTVDRGPNDVLIVRPEAVYG